MRISIWRDLLGSIRFVCFSAWVSVLTYRSIGFLALLLKDPTFPIIVLKGATGVSKICPGIWLGCFGSSLSTLLTRPPVLNCWLGFIRWLPGWQLSASLSAHQFFFTSLPLGLLITCTFTITQLHTGWLTGNNNFKGNLSCSLWKGFTWSLFGSSDLGPFCHTAYFWLPRPKEMQLVIHLIQK